MRPGFQVAGPVPARGYRHPERLHPLVGERSSVLNSLPLSRCLPGRLGCAPGPVSVFSAKTEYGLVALVELAAAYASGERLQTGEICGRHGMPERYLEQMLTALRKGGFLVSVRGPRGGYQLTRSPDQITVAEVEDCLERDARSDREDRSRTVEFRVLEGVAQRAQHARRAVLEATTLAHLLLERDSLRQPSPMFYI